MYRRPEFRLPWNSLGLVAVLGLLVLLFSLQSDYFFSAVTFRTLANQIPALTVIAVGMTYVLLVAGIDLSVGSVMALCAALMGVLMVDLGWSLAAALLASLGAGLACGLANGVISARCHLPSFVVTLGMLEIARGGAYLVTDSQTRYLGGAVGAIGDPLPGFGLSPALLIALAVVAAAQFLLLQTVFGRYLVAIGTNEEAARLSGVDTARWKTLVFAIAGFLAALGGVFQLGYLQSADPNAGIGLELSAIAAVVIGGTSLSGGRGSVVNSFLGVLIITVMQTGLAQLGVSEPGKRIITGAVIIVAVLIDRYREPLTARLTRR